MDWRWAVDKGRSESLNFLSLRPSMASGRAGRLSGLVVEMGFVSFGRFQLVRSSLSS